MYHIRENKFNLEEKDVFLLGKRNNNKKRDFLFISKLLGKHLSVYPEVVKSTGYMLSSLKYGFSNKQYLKAVSGEYKGKVDYKDSAEDDVLVIGFCETATGLGMAVASSIKGCTYQCTTREEVNGRKELLFFEEEHSHATTHHMFNNHVSLGDFQKVILVDDEITTGKSLLNLMEQIEAQTHMEEYNIMAILDWRDDEQREKFDAFAREHDTKVSVYPLISGVLDLPGDIPVYQNGTIPTVSKKYEPGISLDVFPRECKEGEKPYLSWQGRFGCTYEEIERIEQYAGMVAGKVMDFQFPYTGSILVLGHGENIYIPSRVAACLMDYGVKVKFKTTTLSPVYCDGEVIKDAVAFEIDGRKYYYYNTEELDGYNSVVLLSDTEEVPCLSDNYSMYYL